MMVKFVRGILALVLTSTVNLAFSDEQLSPPNKPVPSSFFGMHSIRFHNPALRPRVAVGSWRLWDAGVTWAELQPKRSEWNFERLEFALEVARTNGQDVVLTFGRTPVWASARPTEHSFYGPGAASPPRDMADFAAYVRTVSTRYKGKIRLYEVWNEPASGGMFTGTVEQMVQLTKVAREELSRVDPEIRLVCPSPAKQESLDWFKQFLVAGGANHCDIIGYHFYTDGNQPEDKLKLIAAVRDLLGRHGQSKKPLWDTESGLAIGTKKQLPPSVASYEAQVARWLILAWAGGLERSYWYAWDHDDQGFVHPDGSVREKSLIAYRQVQQWMSGSVFSSCSRAGVLWSCGLILSNGSRGKLMWTEDNTIRPIILSRSARLENIFGKSSKTVVNNIQVGGDPVLIVE